MINNLEIPRVDDENQSRGRSPPISHFPQNYPQDSSPLPYSPYTDSESTLIPVELSSSPIFASEAPLPAAPGSTSGSSRPRPMLTLVVPHGDVQVGMAAVLQSPSDIRGYQSGSEQSSDGELIHWDAEGYMTYTPTPGRRPVVPARDPSPVSRIHPIDEILAYALVVLQLALGLLVIMYAILFAGCLLRAMAKAFESRSP